MSGLEAIKPFLPALTGVGTGVLRIGTGIAERKIADQSADRLEKLGAADARLRGIQAAKLLGNIQASFGGRGIAGGSADDLELEAALLEGIDIARARFRFTSLADQVRRRGDAALFGSVIGAVGDVGEAGAALSRKGDLTSIQDAIERAIAKANKTVLSPSKKTLIPRPVRPGPLTITT